MAGVKASLPSSASRKGVSSLEFRHASICAKVVATSSKVSCTLPTTFLKCCKKLLTAASHKLQKCGACTGVKCHSMCWAVQRPEIERCFSGQSRNLNSSRHSHEVPTKLIPQSLHILKGFPRRAMNLLRVARSAAIVKSGTGSRLTLSMWVWELSQI